MDEQNIKECERMTENPHILYEVSVTIDEYGHQYVIATCNTMEEAKAMLKDTADWYRERGTGRIYKVTKELRYVTTRRKKVYESL